MAYMSYCRYEGTRNELAICLGDVRDHVNYDAEYAVSDREISHFRNIVEDIMEFLWDMNLLTEDGELDREALDEICEKMEKGAKEE